MNNTSGVKDDGGPAFPNNDQHGCAFTGMTLRDWFAGQVLVGHSSQRDDRTCTRNSEISIADQQAAYLKADAEYCYAIADAMIAAREEKGATE